MLQWLDGRNNSYFSSLTWNGTALNFAVSAGVGANGLTVISPIPAGMEVTSITRGGSGIAYTTQVIKGINYAFFSGTSGSYQVNLS
jgi:hypothetical protein